MRVIGGVRGSGGEWWGVVGSGGEGRGDGQWWGEGEW